jgi:UDP-2-acetamido-2,6-beta-L-arabino-hexul-4-ose reductase
VASDKRRILITGAKGFVGQNLTVRLSELEQYSVIGFARGDDPETLPELIAQADAVVHLAGENRPADEAAFDEVNRGLTQQICDAIAAHAQAEKRLVPLVYASSAQALLDNPYGRSKKAGETAVQQLAEATGVPCAIFRFPGIFGKWCRPHYNSVVASFCHNIARGEKVRIDNPDAPLELVYIDDAVTGIIEALEHPGEGCALRGIAPVYHTSVGELAEQIEAFANGRSALSVERVGAGFTRALYATYVSALPQDQFAYNVPEHRDPRGVFVEMLKTPDSGQFSFLTAPPGVTRGGHYHHTKTEKFLVIRGKAAFGFRHLLSGETFELTSEGSAPKIVQTIPGWSHNITNIGEEELIVMLWANEVFDRQRPDTIASEV